MTNFILIDVLKYNKHCHAASVCQQAIWLAIKTAFIQFLFAWHVEKQDEIESEQEKPEYSDIGLWYGLK